MSGRSQSVKINESLSKSTSFECGVVGPILFSLSMAPLRNIIGTFSTVKHSLCADDTHICTSFSNVSNSIKDIQDCLSSVQSWMSANKLKLNPDKTVIEFIVFGNKRQQAELPPFSPADILGKRLVPADKGKTWVLNSTRVYS